MQAADITVSATEQVRYESGVRRRYAVIAAVAGALLVIQAIIQYTGPRTSVSELTLDLITAHKRFPLDLIGSTIDCAGLLTLAVLLIWLHSITRARQPQTRDFIRWMTLVGAILAGALAIAYAVFISVKANQFVSHGNQSYVEANALTHGSIITILPILAQLGSLLLAAGFIWTTLNATRVGLLTRFVGYLGAFAGLLVLFPIGTPVPVVQGFWLGSMAVLIAGRWPSGSPKAWETGEAEPWAPISQPRERGQRPPPRQRSTRRQLAETADRSSAPEKSRGQTATEAAAEAARSGQVSPSTSAAKRKRKRRH